MKPFSDTSDIPQADRRGKVYLAFSHCPLFGIFGVLYLVNLHN